VTANYPGYQPVTRDVTVGTSNITADIGIPIDVYGCIAPGYAANNIGLMEAFDGTSTPAGWTLESTSAGAWEFDDPTLKAIGWTQGNHTGGSGNFAVTNADNATVQNSADMSLASPVTDLSGAANPDVSFDTDFRSFFGTADVDVSTDGGATWQTVWHRPGVD